MPLIGHLLGRDRFASTTRPWGQRGAGEGGTLPQVAASDMAGVVSLRCGRKRGVAAHSQLEH